MKRYALPILIAIIVSASGRSCYTHNWELKAKQVNKALAAESADVRELISSDPDNFLGREVRIIDGPGNWKGRKDYQINKKEYKYVMGRIKEMGFTPYCRNYITNRIVTVSDNVVGEERLEIPKVEELYQDYETDMMK